LHGEDKALILQFDKCRWFLVRTVWKYASGIHTSRTRLCQTGFLQCVALVCADHCQFLPWRKSSSRKFINSLWGKNSRLVSYLEYLHLNTVYKKGS
jgi:hypothetical protein